MTLLHLPLKVVLHLVDKPVSERDNRPVFFFLQLFYFLRDFAEDFTFLNIRKLVFGVGLAYFNSYKVLGLLAV